MYYILIFEIKKKVTAYISKNTWYIEPGLYLYVGRAKKNLNHRIKRHISKTKKLRWHIDHLTSNKASTVIGYILIPLDSFKSECEIAKELEKYGLNRLKLGATDCRCNGHLLWKESSLDKILKIIKNLEGKNEKDSSHTNINYFSVKLLNHKNPEKNSSPCPNEHSKD